jgi:hypothetical protein
LNPFGQFRQSQSEKMRKLYGQIPPTGTRSDALLLAERLALFLCDFLVDTGPLVAKEDEYQTESIKLENVASIDQGEAEDSPLILAE